MKILQATDEARAWLRKKHPDVRCSRCAYCGAIGSYGCVCYENATSELMMIPYAHGEHSCGFKWDLKSAAREAYDRIAYMGGVDSLPPMVRDAYAILGEGLEHERKIIQHNESEDRNGSKR